MVRLNANGRNLFIRHFDRRLIYTKSIKRRKAQRCRMRLMLTSRNFIPPLDTRFELKEHGYYDISIEELYYFNPWMGSLENRRDCRLLNVILKLLLRGFVGSAASLTVQLCLPKSLKFNCLEGKRLIKTLVLCRESTIPIHLKIWSSWVHPRGSRDPFVLMMVDILRNSLASFSGDPINASVLYGIERPLRKIWFNNTDNTSAATMFRVPAEHIQFHSQFVPECAADITYQPNPHLRRLIIPVDFTKPLDVSALRAGLCVLRKLNPELKLRMRSRNDYEMTNYGEGNLNYGDSQETIVEKMRKDIQMAKEYIDASIDLFPLLEVEPCSLRIRCYKRDPLVVEEYAKAIGFDMASKDRRNDILHSIYAGALIRVPVLSL